MNIKAMWALVIGLFLVILVMAYFLFAIPAPVTPVVSTSTPVTVVTQTPTTTTNETPETQPLSARVTITSPKSGATVGQTFEVTGSAPGNWYFEASFPIQIRDKDGNVIGRTHANAQGDWMTTKLVNFKATINVEGGYKGPAKLVLMKDNPSGLPENDDSKEISIVIQ